MNARRGLAILCILGASVGLHPVFAADYQVRWSVVAGGGGKMTSVSYQAKGTVGQTGISKGISTSYQGCWGFWQKDAGGGPGPGGAWAEKNSMPPGAKPVADGGWLAFNAGNELIYAARGNKTPDFFRYNPADGNWASLSAVPLGREAKPPGKGAVGCADGSGIIYATKGNSTCGFYRYEAAKDSWYQLTDVPLGVTNKKVKGGTDAVFHDGSVYLLKGGKNEFWKYNIANDSWISLPAAPLGSSSKDKYDKGSWLAPGPEPLLYVHKAKYHELFTYDVTKDSWTAQLTGMPFVSATGKSKKSKDGGSAALKDGFLYALKGGGTQEFWRFTLPAGPWAELETMPQFGSTMKKKKVKAGGDITATAEVLFALKGNKTNELWQYTPGGLQSATNGSRPEGVMASQQDARHPFVLYAGAPSQFVTRTNLQYSLPREGLVSLKVYDISGRPIRTLADCRQGPGLHSSSWDGRDGHGRMVANGIYFCKLMAGGEQMTRKLVLQR